jgi:hypothetical protein
VVILVPRNESSAVKVVVSISPDVWRTYVAPLGFVGVGVKVSNSGKEGGLPCLSHHGSCSKHIKFSGCRAKSCKVEIVVAWPRAQFSICTAPYGCRKGHLIGHSCHRGVSCSCSSLGESSQLDSLGAIWVISFIRCVAVHTTDGRVGASWTFLANGKGIRMLSGIVGTGADGTAGVVPTKRSRISIGLAVVVLGTSSIWDVVVQLALLVAHDKVLASDCILFDITGQCHNNRRGYFVLAAFC